MRIKQAFLSVVIALACLTLIETSRGVRLSVLIHGNQATPGLR